MDPQRMFGMTPWVRRLIVANLVVFLLQVTLFVSPGFIGTLGLTPLYAFRQPWTFVTYKFVHANLLHLAFNLLALYVFGPEVEERMGGGAFVRYYLLCGLGGAVLSLVLGWSFGRLNPVVGASAAVYGVLLAFAWAAPDAPINGLFCPAPIAAARCATQPDRRPSHSRFVDCQAGRVPSPRAPGRARACLRRGWFPNWGRPPHARQSRAGVPGDPRRARPQRGLSRVSRPPQARAAELLAQLRVGPDVAARGTGNRGHVARRARGSRAAARGRGRRRNRGGCAAAFARAFRGGLRRGPVSHGGRGRRQRGRIGGGRTRDCLRMSRAFHRPTESPDVRHGTRAALVAALDRARGGARGAVHVADETARPEAAGDRPARLLRLLGHRQPGHLAGAARERGGGRGGGAGGGARVRAVGVLRLHPSAVPSHPGARRVPATPGSAVTGRDGPGAAPAFPVGGHEPRRPPDGGEGAAGALGVLSRPALDRELPRRAVARFDGAGGGG